MLAHGLPGEVHPPRVFGYLACSASLFRSSCSCVGLDGRTFVQPASYGCVLIHASPAARNCTSSVSRVMSPSK